MNTVQVLQKMDRETKAEVFIVGGFVRDFLRRKNNEDLDIVIRGMSFHTIKKYLKRFGKVKEVKLAKTNDSFTIKILLFKASSRDYEAQISLPRRRDRRRRMLIPASHNTLKQDVKTRDFKINCLYLPINYKSRKDVIDIVGGKDDIVARRITANGSSAERIRESPIRMMRAISLAARTGYTLDRDVVNAIQENKHLLDKVPAEAIRTEFDKILLSKKPSRFIRLLFRTGLLSRFAPEIANCSGVQQDKKYHKFDVFTHLLYSVDNCEKNHSIRLAALLHDVGKAETRRVIRNGGEERTTFHKHEMVSVKLAREFMRRLKYDKAKTEEVLDLVKHHMYHYTRDWNDATVRKFIKKAGISENYINSGKISEFPLFKLRAAERLGSGFKTIAVTDRQRDFERRIVEVYRESKGLDIKDLAVNGHKLMEMFNLGQGKQIGSILKFLLDRVLENPDLNNELDLLKLATEYIHDNK
jgi:putative nucleotidyltransferase with HDIG domain